MKVFLIDESEYVAALSEDQAMEYYRELVGTSEDEDLSIDEVPFEMWPTITIVDESATIEQETGEDGFVKYTLDNWMERFTEADLPQIVAYKL